MLRASRAFIVGLRSFSPRQEEGIQDARTTPQLEKAIELLVKSKKLQRRSVQHADIGVRRTATPLGQDGRRALIYGAFIEDTNGDRIAFGSIGPKESRA